MVVYFFYLIFTVAPPNFGSDEMAYDETSIAATSVQNTIGLDMKRSQEPTLSRERKMEPAVQGSHELQQEPSGPAAVPKGLCK